MQTKLSLTIGTVTALTLLFSGQPAKAVATVSTATCSGIYYGLGTSSEANGTKTLPGTDVGTVVAGCQIGDIATNNVSGTGVFVSSNANPSIFQFEWGGGVLGITEKLGNNGTLLNGVDVELGVAAGNTVNPDGSLGSSIAMINIPHTAGGGPSPFETLYTGTLAAGTYVIDNYAGSPTSDPTYQIDFAVPEPASLAILGGTLFGVGAARRRRKTRKEN